MDWMQSSAALVLGFLLRLGIPVVLTGVLVWLLRRLDARWQVEADRMLASRDLGTAPVSPVRCWEVKDCPPHHRVDCPGFKHPERPCWQVFRDPNGCLQEHCLGCVVFRSTPVPGPA